MGRLDATITAVDAGKTYTVAAYEGVGCAAGLAVIGRVQFFIPAAVSLTINARPRQQPVGDVRPYYGLGWRRRGIAARKGTFRISGDGTATGTFAVDDSTAINCKDGGACDVDDVAGWITLRVNVAGDSPRGALYVQRYTRMGGDFMVGRNDEKTINVAAAASVARVTITASPTSIAAASGRRPPSSRLLSWTARVGAWRTSRVNVITTNGTLKNCVATPSGVLGCTDEER